MEKVSGYSGSAYVALRGLQPKREPIIRISLGSITQLKRIYNLLLAPAQWAHARYQKGTRLPSKRTGPGKPDNRSDGGNRRK